MKGKNRRINTRYRVSSMVDIRKESYSFVELLEHRRVLYLKYSGVGSGIGVVYWLFYLSRYRHHVPLDKYVKLHNTTADDGGGSDIY